VIEMSTAWSAALALLAGLPMLWALYAAGVQSLDLQAWQDLAADPQSLRAWGLTLWTGLAASILTWLTVASLLGHGFIRQRLGRWVQQLPALLATPHAALAVGLVLWLSPSGWALRLASPGITGFTAPPPWLSTQDPWGLGLILGLWVKEVPFLLWVAATQMQREDLRRRWQAECALAQTLGRTPTQAFAQILWPQLAQRLRWPALAVLAYSLTVVDMALIMGPASPPTLAVLAWQWLGDANIRTQAQGVAAAALLTLSVLVLALLWCWRPLAQLIGVKATGAILGSMRKLPIWPFMLLLYLAVWWALVLGSVSGVWPFPKVLPSVWTGQAWLQVRDSADTVIVTLTLAAASASLCLIWGVAWLEFGARTWQRALRPWFLLPLVLPSVLWVVGLYGLALQWRLEGQWSGLLLAHALMVLPYVLLALEPAYLAVDARQAAVAASLGHARWVYLWRVKWPLLKRALCSAWAVGFAVSVAQYLPTLYVGAGRFATVTTEAVTLASGSQRSLMSAYAALQMILPLIVFALATWWGRPRRFERTLPMKAAA
jgi:putative thiamine transport system permease protein